MCFTIFDIKNVIVSVGATVSVGNANLAPNFESAIA